LIEETDGSEEEEQENPDKGVSFSIVFVSFDFISFHFISFHFKTNNNTKKIKNKTENEKQDVL